MRSKNPNAKNNANVAHNWAHNTGRLMNGSNFFYDSHGIIYSYGYHFPIAVNVANSHYLFTLKSYSASTAKHISLVRRAIPDMANIIYMHTVPKAGEAVNHQTNISYWLGELEGNKKAFNTAKNKAKVIDAIQIVLNQIDRYVAYFQQDFTPELTEFNAWYGTIDGESIRTEQAAKDVKRTAQKAATEERKLQQQIEEFRTFEIKSITADSTFAYLRYNATNETVETSKGIVIPQDKAVSFYRLIMSAVTAIRGGRSVDLKDSAFSIQGYKVNEITTECIVIGCHRITLAEMHKAYAMIP